MERQKTADSWDNAKLEKLAVAYNDYREQMWKVIGHNMGEKWQVVEAKVSSIQCQCHLPYSSSVVYGEGLEESPKC